MKIEALIKYTFLACASALTTTIQAQAPGSSASPTAAESPDATFVQAAGRGGLAEVELSQLALHSSDSQAVIAFAQNMVRDHTKNNKELILIAAHENVAVPTDLDREHAQLRDRLASLHGANFDHAYVKAMREDHQKMADMLMSSEATVSTEELRAFIKQTLPVVQGHLRMANDLKAN